MAILALGLAGAGLTSAIGIGGSVGWLGGVIVGNLLFGGNKGQTQEGPRLGDLSVQTSTYGAPIPLVYGTMRLSGNVIWSIDLKETRHEQTTRGGKGGGSSTQITYSYAVSFAVGLCAGPVSTVRRIWADTKLIYDATAGNTQATEKYPGIIRIHTGDEDHMPDSTIEMALGIGNVPAYRGLCYLVFTDLQLADFANRIPNISAEVVAAGGMQCNAVILPPIGGMFREGGWIDPARGVLICTNATQIYKYDLINNQLLLNVPLGVHDVYGKLAGIDSEGNYYHASDAFAVSMRIVKRHADTLAVMARTDPTDLSTAGAVRRDKIFGYTSRIIYELDLIHSTDLSAFLPSYGAPGAPMCDDPDGRYWQAGPDKIRRLDGPDGGVTDWDVAAWTDNEMPRALFWDDFTGHLYFTLGSGKRIVKWHPDTGYAGHVDNVAIPAGYGLQSDSNLPQHGKLWAAADTEATLVDLVAMRLEKTIDLTPFAPTAATHFGGCYEKFTHSVVIMSDAGEVKYPLERYGSDAVPLSNVLTDLCLKAGMEPTDIVTGAVSHALRGYIVSSRMTARDALQPLLGTFFVDAVEADGTLKFLPRGQSPVGAIAYDDLGAAEGNDNAVQRLHETRTQDVELPRRIDLTHVDPDRDYQTNTQHAARIADAVGTQDLQSIQLSIVLTANEAARVAERTLTNAWVERDAYEFNLPPKWLRLDPADVVTVTTPEANFTLRLNQVDFGGNNIVACKAVAEDVLAYISTAAGANAALPSVPIRIATPVGLFLMDLPMLRAEDDNIGLYYAFGLRESGSAALYRSPDELAWSIAGTGSVGPAFGWAASVLGDTARPWRWDETNNVQIALSHGALDSKTALEVLNWNNVALLGNEILQWRDATLLADNLYQLSGLLRGRRGTEDATGTHKIGERFVVLAPEGFYRTPLPATENGRTSYYKGLRSGGNWDDTPIILLAFEARSLRCFSPVHIKGSRDGSGNLSLSWHRRARWYGEWLDNADAPLFEDSEAYEVDILSSDDVVRTLHSSALSASYSAAQQTADFGTPQAALEIAVYQLNAIIGRGEPGRAVL